MKNNIFSDQRLNYKDFLIIIACWYFINLNSYYISEQEFADLIYINEILSFIINVLSHFVFLIIIYIYFNLMYDFSFYDLGFNFKKEKINFKALTPILIILTIGVIMINLNYNTEIQNSFFPLQLKGNIIELIFNNLPLLLILFLTLIFTAGVEQFLFNKIIFALFDLYLPTFAAVILNALFASILFLEFNPAFILIIFTSVMISNYLYLISNQNLFTPIIFYGYFITIYIVFLYGFQFKII